MNKEMKKIYIQEMKETFNKSSSVFVTHYQGLTVKQIDALKSEMRKNGVNVLPEGRAIMFNPAYIVSEPQIDHFVDTLEVILNKAE